MPAVGIAGPEVGVRDEKPVGMSFIGRFSPGPGQLGPTLPGPRLSIGVDRVPPVSTRQAPGGNRMSLRSSFSPAVARLVTGTGSPTVTGRREPPSRGQLYRPLIAGPAILRRVDGAGPWQVTVSVDGLLRPLVPGSGAAVRRLMVRQRRSGVLCRIGLALVSPEDLLRAASCNRGDDAHARSQARDPARRLRMEIYGWSLMIQLPGIRGIATVDAHDTIDDLPAFYESPLELVDRANHLAARGIPSRPIAVVTQPEDFEHREDGCLLNRFHPQTRFRRPCSLETLL